MSKDIDRNFIELENKKSFDYGKIRMVSFEILYDFKHELDLNDLLAFGVTANDVNFCKKMIRLGADINCKSGIEENLLHIACRHNCHETAKFLIDQNFDINIRGVFGHTPLHNTCSHNSFECAQLLIELGADVNNENRFGFTALGIALEYSHKKLIDLLIQNGAHE